MSINSDIISVLSPIAPTDFHEYTGASTTYMTFFTYNQRAGTNADDDEQTTIFSIQLDIYSKGNIEIIAKQAKEALKVLGFRRTWEMDVYERTTKTFRKNMSLSVSREA